MWGPEGLMAGMVVVVVVVCVCGFGGGGFRLGREDLLAAVRLDPRHPGANLALAGPPLRPAPEPPPPPPPPPPHARAPPQVPCTRARACVRACGRFLLGSIL